MKRISRKPLTLFPISLRPCTLCKQHLEASKFGPKKKSSDGLDSRCKRCKTRATSAYLKRLREAGLHDPSKRLSNHLKKYGLTSETFTAMAQAQNDQCATCGETMKGRYRRNIDHCHKTGRTRALLCRLCNTALGAARDNPTTLRAMADYIEHWQREHAAHRLNTGNTPGQEQPWPEARDVQTSDAA